MSTAATQLAEALADAEVAGFPVVPEPGELGSTLSWSIDWRAVAESLVSDLHLSVAELVEAARDTLQNRSHDGPCINYDFQPPGEYDESDSCYRHLESATRRRDRLSQAINAYDKASS